MSCNNSVSFFPTNFILQNHHDDHEIHPQSLVPKDFHGLVGGKRSFNSITTCSGSVNKGEEEFSFSEDLVEKKRRLNIEQVKTLEKSFEMGNKLDPERKLELARALGLQPRQIAIWFQNRRARWKTKQLEKDYDSLHRQIQTLTHQNHFLLTQNQKLLAQVRALKSGEAKESLNLNKETEGSCSENSLDEQITVVPAEIDRELTGGYPPSSSMTIGRRQFSTTTTMQFFEKSSLGENMVKEENSISNILCGIDEQSEFWPWLDQQHYQ